MFKQISLWGITLYQRTLSPDHGPLKKYWPAGYCQFSPTCSQYSYEAVEKYGFWKGWRLAIWRVARCNPFSSGGYDPVR